MSITTGKAPLTAMTLTAILSLSLIVNLPGLAVSPMLSTLSTIFPSTTQLEKQLLTLLPNLVIIPFVLLSGKLSLSTHKVAVIILSLVIFTGAGVAYLFAKSMVALIVISCVLGLGAGLLTPFCTGLLADTFAGRYRMNMMGIQSGVSNIALVIGTYAVGWLSGVNWHLPFVVYLVSIIPLIFSFKLGGIPKQDLMAPRLTAAQENDPKNDKATEYSPIPGEKVVNGFYIGRTVQMVASYFFITFAVMTITYYASFVVQKYHWHDSVSGTIISLFYLFIFLPGFFLGPIVKLMKGSTIIICTFIMVIGMALMGFLHAQWSLCLGSALAGLGYGVCQPLVYDKASRTVVSTRKSTLALAIVLTASYAAIVLTAPIVDGFRALLGGGKFPAFSFALSAALLLLYFFLTLWKRNSFAFNIDKSYY